MVDSLLSLAQRRLLSFRVSNEQCRVKYEISLAVLKSFRYFVFLNVYSVN